MDAEWLGDSGGLEREATMLWGEEEARRLKDGPRVVLILMSQRGGGGVAGLIDKGGV